MKRLVNKRTITIFLMSLLFSATSYSQEDFSAEHQLHHQLTYELDGVYQIQMIGIRTKPMIDTDLLKRIKTEQKENEEFSFYHKSNIKVVIKSKNDVTEGKLFTQEEIISYINE